jgi:hypothetical protein
VALDEFLPTNYLQLMRDFRRMPAEQQVRVLQGFSWRIIKSRNRWVRRQTIVGLIVNDVLGLMNGDIQTLLSNEQLMLPVVRLFLYISEDLYGSKVLFRNGGLYKEIIDLIPTVLSQKNYECLAVVLEILENIWHNREILVELINLNIIDLCVNVLLEDPQVRGSDELLESIATLLLNATALTEGLDSFQTQINIFFSLSEAFREASDSNRNLIGAIMYGLLGREEMWRLAHEAKLPNFIDDLLKIDFRSNKQQLLLLQQKLVRFESGKTIEEDYDQEQSFDSNLEEEIFERNEEELTELEDYIAGHEMLGSKYALRGKEAEKVPMSSRSKWRRSARSCSSSRAGRRNRPVASAGRSPRRRRSTPATRRSRRCRTSASPRSGPRRKTPSSPNPREQTKRTTTPTSLPISSTANPKIHTPCRWSHYRNPPITNREYTASKSTKKNLIKNASTARRPSRPRRTRAARPKSGNKCRKGSRGISGQRRSCSTV